MSKNINIEKQEIIKLSDRIQVKIFYEYQDTICLPSSRVTRKNEELRCIFTIQNQNWKPEIKVNLETGQVNTSSFSFELIHFQEDLKTIFDYVSKLKFEKNIFNY